jgi:hypothetical protein
MPSESNPTHELAKTYISLATQMHAQYDARRSLEWKIHIAAWTLLAASAFAIASLHLTIPGRGLQIALWLFVVFHFVGTIKLHKGEIEDQKLSIGYRERADKLLNQLETDTANVKPAAANKHWSWLRPRFKAWGLWTIAEVGTTVCLVAVVLIINGAPKPSPDPIASLQADNAALRGDVSALRVQYADLQKKLDQATTLLQQQRRDTGAGSRKR